MTKYTRREFLGILGIGAALAVVDPKLLLPEEELPENVGPSPLQAALKDFLEKRTIVSGYVPNTGKPFPLQHNNVIPGYSDNLGGYLIPKEYFEELVTHEDCLVGTATWTEGESEEEALKRCCEARGVDYTPPEKRVHQISWRCERIVSDWGT